MKLLLLLLACLSLSFISCEPEQYKMTVSISGSGAYKIVPEKNEYEEGETVTITAIADSGWRFRKWEGSTPSSKTNPLTLVMDGQKNISVVFGIPIEPDLTGTWESEQYLVTFEIEQPDPFEIDLKGKMIATLNTGSKLIYNFTGSNNNPQIRLLCKKSGFYDINYHETLINDNHIDGYVVENSVAYDCDLLRVTESPLLKNRLPLAVNKAVDPSPGSGQVYVNTKKMILDKVKIIVVGTQYIVSLQMNVRIKNCKGDLPTGRQGRWLAQHKNQNLRRIICGEIKTVYN